MDRDVFQIPDAAWTRFSALRDEEQSLERMWKGQVGTSIPRLWTGQNSFILNPSNVGTGMIARMIQTDETVQGAMMFKNLMMLAKIGEFHHDNTEIADHVNDGLAALKYPSWNESLESQASAHGFGFSCSEITSGLNKNLQRVPVRLSTYHPSTLAFEADIFGNITPMGVLQFVYQYGQQRNPNNWFPKIQYGWTVENPFSTPTDRLVAWRMPFFAQYGLVRIPREKVIHHTSQPMMSFGGPYGQTAVRTAHLAWQLKVFLLKQTGIAIKRAATPTLWGAAPAGKAAVEYTQPSKDGSRNGHPHRPKAKETLSPRKALMRVLSDRETSDAVVTGSEEEGYKITAIANGADFEQLGGLLDRLDVRIFRSFLLPSLVMTDGSAGSRSLGDKHFQIVDFIAAEEAKKFGQKIINDMIEPWIKDNFGEQEDYGYFGTRPQNIEERERLAGIYTNLTNSGWMKPYVKDDVDFVRKTLSLPKDTDTSFNLRDPLEQQVDREEIDADDKEKLKSELAQFRSKIELARAKARERGQKGRKK